jgi:DNA-3-methyladenine glycosylase I
MTAEDFRAIALSLPQALEGAHMGHPDFRVGGKIFATLGYPGGGWAMVKLTPDQQRDLVRRQPDIFQAVKGGWGRRGCTNVILEQATETDVRPAMMAAWRNAAPKKLANGSGIEASTWITGGSASEPERCGWAKTEQYVLYHDKEWGVPAHEDRVLFEFLILEGAQAGLSWATILNKRENYRVAFDRFDPELVAKYGKAKVKALLANAGIVRNRLKIEAAIANARAFLAVQEEFGSFDEYVWGFVDGKPIQNSWKSVRQLPAKSSQSDAMSKALKQRGFKFVGSTICYAFMQAVGMVNDHLVQCFRHAELAKVGQGPS